MPFLQTDPNEQARRDAIAQALQDVSPQHKDDQYAAAARLLQKYFTEGGKLVNPRFGTVHVLDTHGRKVLKGTSPDIVVQRNGDEPEMYCIAVVIDVKTGTNYETPENCGKIMDYLYKLQEVQHGRTSFIGCLANYRTVLIIHYEDSGPGAGDSTRRVSGDKGGGLSFKMTHYRISAFSQSLAFIHDLLCNSAVNPGSLPFSSQPSVVAIYLHNTHETCIIKASRNGPPDGNPSHRSSSINEINTLKILPDREMPACTPPFSLPTQRFHSLQSNLWVRRST